MTDAERQTLQKLYADARWDTHLLRYSYRDSYALLNNEMWQRVDDFIGTHGITDDEYEDAISKVVIAEKVEYLKYDGLLPNEDYSDIHPALRRE